MTYREQLRTMAANYLIHNGTTGAFIMDYGFYEKLQSEASDDFISDASFWLGATAQTIYGFPILAVNTGNKDFCLPCSRDFFDKAVKSFQ